VCGRVRGTCFTPEQRAMFNDFLSRATPVETVDSIFLYREKQ